MKKISKCFDISSVREYTVELGRPDVITLEKLRAVIKKQETITENK